ncbi:hypothetical protein P153DRAFT_382047 [Dothidotthia symphoricarpi CBS 119687]|uniref:Uncharacterized protein n=1 Tax=Dothidotthia symphoricarpi CBS 119687 TaxID=1392245 RepID=A0A6A6AR14_9PLEO|nr:uncharacterized protein P153DRAFT_382047 [Dothidotthia symphoricarpi CBS 119687]KAF2133618.1 hypothetical protein P153DRAFT_382047 [Dothidotthia symphoricarpi CBS 119687]
MPKVVNILWATQALTEREPEQIYYGVPCTIRGCMVIGPALVAFDELRMFSMVVRGA